MIGALLLAAAVAQAAADPCQPVRALERDPAGAALYRAVGDEERTAGRSDSATVAFQGAAARDPADGESRAALSELCAERRRERDFQRALEAVHAGDCAGALPALEAARAAGDHAAALLQGICLYQAGADGPAAAALADAGEAPATRASARLFQGLLARRAGHLAEAARLVEAAGDDPLLAPLVRDLSRSLGREGRLVLSAEAEGGWDSNVDLTPGASPAPSGAGAAFSAGGVGVSVAPWLERGPYAQVTAVWREPVRHQSLGLTGFDLAAGIQAGGPRRQVLAEVGYQDRHLGGRPYLETLLALSDGRIRLGPALGAAAGYELRRESFRGEVRDYSGLQHAGRLELAVEPSGWLQLSLAWRGERALARRAWLGHLQQGPFFAATAALGAHQRLRLEAGLTWRRYGGVDPDLGRRRSDAYADGAARLEVDLGTRWVLLCALAARRAYSNLPEFRYARLVPTAGLSFTLGVP